ncbi:MAG: hypothetical protein EWM50_05990 [Gottschalkiaceae bacterium]|nr:MAG: hypothetical protein EWM50_05990 [Gottschalkiaceae bacterium]
MSKIYISKEEYIREAQKNPWLKRGGIDFEEDPFMEMDYGYELTYVSSIENLLQKIGRGDWPIRQAFGYNSLVFANQVNGGDDWLAIKKFDDGIIKSFDTITFGRMIRDGKTWTGKNIVQFIKDLDKANDDEELKKAWYLKEYNKVKYQEIQEEYELEI